MTTMFDATLELASELGVLRTSTATGGTATTLIDTKRTESDDAYNGGTIWLITDAGGASAAPEGEWARVSDFVNSTGTFTMAAMTAAPANEDEYGCATGDFSLDMLISAINKELKKYTKTRYDRTSLDIESDQSEYTLPSGIRGDNLINVYEETDTDTDDSNPVPLNFWVQEADTGSQHTLVIDTTNVTAGNDITLEYEERLTSVYSASDVIDDVVPLARILPAAAANARMTRMSTDGVSSPVEVELIRMHREDARRAERENLIRKPARRGRVTEA